MKSIPALLAFAVLSLATGCATLGKDETGEKLTLAETSATDFTAVDARSDSGVAAYTTASGSHKAEWIRCSGPAPQGTVVALHTDRAGFEKDRFCSGWIAQGFLSQGFDVVTVNRPGYGGSTGDPDFGGARSIAALKAGLSAAGAKGSLKKPMGVWGYGTGATAAALFARSAGDYEFMILGGGVYDYEEAARSTQDSYLKKEIATIQKTGGSKAIEERSIAWDVSGFPKRVAIYHGKLDTAVPHAQAKAFADSLQSSEYKVTFQVIDGFSHDIPWVHHRKLIEILAKTMTTGS